MPRNADNERHWHTIAQCYDLQPGPINLENGYFGRMSRAVQAQYLEHISFINRSNSVHVRQRFEQGENVEIRRTLAALIDVDPESIAFTRNATEALQSLIRNYNRLQPGDQVLISDLEYDTVKGAMRWLADVRGVEVIEVSHTHPASFDSLVQTYNKAFAQYPRLKLMALTHVTHRTGLVMPVAAIAKAAREQHIDVILDGAHALGQFEFNLAELGIQFAGFNLHKWMGAPLTLGFLYIAPERLADIDPDMGEFHYPATDVRARTSYSTPNFPALMTLPLVFEEHRQLGGAAAKGARVNYLRDLWVNQVRPLPGIEVLTSDDPRLYCGITAFKFLGRDQQVMVDRMLRDYDLFTTTRVGASFGTCIRVTPGLVTSAADIDVLVNAINQLSTD
ncbi:aminotransferase class V-fold PLP-dependent enzyme [Pseudomonas sp. P867]|jgi:isopenicillin-N epimerase|uniref:Aminotransferase class V-fold PLP-dependent enzyme n=1 Tax=Pseudomonas synxantha TaxID=47883 RepID=A0A5D3GEN9_9PSED|nr:MULTISPECIES: aminotransferase class V-fold PLP-dependent enzyme [Pseudomonas]KFF46217.1 class V aminotransferase [Pseudomonas sp. BRG-100]MBY8970116.1 aminotransferase class V-fold PLP-dependent enzyme [Pseudomonas sp. P867]MCK3828948.1 aminotransferase class V-fold PLP-dependent enzyme [Pseudomonas sp. W2Aug9]OPB00503.1 class V aminotransferase [Pseudomonas synxantha]TYK59049.1 aminotransferase class V-fold PLP-dependent enzyme [Pseudomonas synxantha]